MELNERIKSRREELGLSDVDVAHASGLTIDSYYDIELYRDELCEAVPLGAVRRLCTVLQFNLVDLLELPCAFCKLGYRFQDEYSLAPNRLIRLRRESRGWSVDELGRRVNYRGVEIAQMEANPDHIDNWRISDLKDLARVLEIPLQLLLGVPCATCGR